MCTLTLFDELRMQLREAIDLTISFLQEYGRYYRHWAVAYSGGKDSSTVVTLVAHLIKEELIPCPESLAVLYCDTRQELPLRQISAIRILEQLKERDIKTEVILPEIDKRFFCYRLGRGIPPLTIIP